MKALILCLLFISCTNSQQEIKYAPQEVIANDTLTKLINDERIDKGLNELKSEKLLIQLSKEKVIEMEANQEVSHNGFTNIETHALTYSEIVGYGYENETNLFNSYMSSLEHKDKILGNYTHIGSYTYKSYNCVLFAKY